MARRFSRIPRVDGTVASVPLLQDEINVRIDEINRVYEEIETLTAQQMGEDNRVPNFLNAPKLNGKRITDVGRSREGSDVVTRRELLELGILSDRPRIGNFITGDLTISGDVVSGGGGGGGGGGAATGGSEVVRDGDTVVFESPLGGPGTTIGTLVYGVDGDGRARPTRTGPGGLQVSDPQVVDLLCTLIAEVRELRACLEER